MPTGANAVAVAVARAKLGQGEAGAMTDVWFYHLERAPLERVLPSLLEKTLARDWKAVVQVGSKERMKALDTLLWTYDPGSFLPHGTEAMGEAERQPIWLTIGDETPNGAAVRFLVDGAVPGRPDQLDPFERAIFIFDGHDGDALQTARAQWKALKAHGHSVTYWQQSARGAWEKKA